LESRGIKIGAKYFVKSGMKLFEFRDQAITECFAGRVTKNSFLAHNLRAAELQRIGGAAALRQIPR
jgi:hypothetical protein